MRNIKRLVNLLLAGLLAVSTMAGCGEKESAAIDENSIGAEAENDIGEGKKETSEWKEPIIIGCETSLTGEKALTGEYMKKALDLAAERINAEGGLLGREVQRILEDDQGTDQGAVNAYNKLASSGACAVIGNLYSTMNVAISGEVEKQDFLQLLQEALYQLEN